MDLVRCIYMCAMHAHTHIYKHAYIYEIIKEKTMNFGGGHGRNLMGGSGVDTVLMYNVLIFLKIQSYIIHNARISF